MLAVDGFNLFPNPCKGQVNIVGGSGSYRIANVMGQVLMTGTIQGDSQQVNVGRLSKGMYFVTINGVTKKLIVYN